MVELRINQASRHALQARFAIPEGQAALHELARLIAQTTFDATPPDLLASLETQEGMSAFSAAWPDLVDALLLQGARKEALAAGTRTTISKGGRRRRLDPGK